MNIWQDSNNNGIPNSTTVREKLTVDQILDRYMSALNKEQLKLLMNKIDTEGYYHSSDLEKLHKNEEDSKGDS